jgi:hypothetical protein
VGDLRYVPTILLVPQSEKYDILNYAFLSSTIGVNRTQFGFTTRFGSKGFLNVFLKAVKIHPCSRNTS